MRADPSKYPRLAKYGVGSYPVAYAALTLFGKLVFNTRTEIKVEGQVPVGSHIIACKHESSVDAPLEHYELSDSKPQKLARHDFFDVWYKNLFFTRSESVPVDRTGEDVQLNIEAANYAADRLVEGKPALTFPEKHRHQGHIGHIYTDGLRMLDLLARRRGIRVPVVAASHHYEDGRSSIKDVLNPLAPKPHIRIVYSKPRYIRDFLTPEAIEEWLAEEYIAALGFEYINDEYNKCIGNLITTC